MSGGEEGDAASWRSYLRAAAKPSQLELQQRLLDHLVEEFGVSPRPPRTGSRPYLNLYPPAAYGPARIGNLAIPSGRFYAMADTKRLDLHLRAVLAAETAEGKYLTVVVRSESDLGTAAAILQCAFDDRAEQLGLPHRSRVRTVADEAGHTAPSMAPPVQSPAEPETPEQQPVPAELPAEQVAAARKMVESGRYRSQVRALPQGAPDDERVAATLALLLARGGRATFLHVAQAVGMPERRVQGYLARLATLLAVEGAVPLTVDTDGREARLDVGLAQSLFGP